MVGMIRSGLNLISQAISIHDQDLKLVHANDRFQAMFDIPDDLMAPGADFATTLTHLAVHGEYGQVDDIDVFVQDKVALARKFEPHYFERSRANGTSISVDGCPLDEGGWITVYTDITEIKQQEERNRSHTESLSEELLDRSAKLAATNRELTATVRALELARQELQASRERLDLINRMTPAHIAHVDANGLYTHSNGWLARILPETEADVIGRHMRDVLGRHVWSHVAPQFEQAFAGKENVSEFRDDQSGKYVRLAMTPEVGPRGDVEGIYILSTDVTEEVTTRNALTYSRRRELATQLTSAMAHDFSNLLTIIMGQQSRLDSIRDVDPEVLDISDTIKSAARRGADLVGRLNSVSPQLGIDPSTVKLDPFLKAFLALAQAALPDGITCELINDLPDDRLIFDAGFAQDALLNLVINAGEACGEQGAINIHIRKTPDKQLQIQVLDDGPGFEPDALDKALNPFFSTKDGKVGRGLGLTSAYDFAKSSGGILKFANQPKGGAIVTMRIPYLIPTPDEHGLVLLVDDDDDVRKSVRGYLRAYGHDVIEAASVNEATQLLTIDGLSLIVTDLDIGKSGTGLDVAKAAPPHVPVLVITGLPGDSDLRQAAQNAHLVLSKPFGFDDLKRQLDKIAT